jgi:hypothetical protein
MLLSPLLVQALQVIFLGFAGAGLLSLLCNVSATIELELIAISTVTNYWSFFRMTSSGSKVGYF